MTLRATLPALALLVALPLAGCAIRSSPRSSVLGRSVTVVPRQQGAPRVRGELLAVEKDAVYVRDGASLQELKADSIKEVRVQRHGLTGKKAMAWALVGGLVSGILLGGACSSVEDSDGCAGVGLAAAGLWLAVGALSAPSLEASSRFTPFGLDGLRPYARFPAGLPKDVPRQSLLPGPPAPK